jgi:phosphoribosylaminoimidazole carboxylase PurE protein
MSVLIVVGSKSDLPVIEECQKTLTEMNIPSDVVVASAHRDPEKVAKLAKEAENKYKVIIAGAGKAAHLPGVIAGHTTLPVIGVPMQTKDLGGMDSLLSIVQMPSGVPVATVAIGGAKNAAVLAAQILALSNQEIKNSLKKFKDSLKG